MDGFETNSFRRKEKYLLFKKLVKITLECNDKCYIFGGYVRDTYLHYIAAKKFYNEVAYTADGYADPMYQPDTFEDRNRVARDIDIFVDAMYTDELFTIITTEMERQIIGLKLQNYHQIKAYCWHPEYRTNFHTIRYRFVYVFNQSLQKNDTSNWIHFHIDVIFKKLPTTRAPWYYLPDFDCNRLYITNNGMNIGGGEDLLENALFLERTLRDLNERKTSVSRTTYKMLFPDTNSENEGNSNIPNSLPNSYQWRAKFIQRLILMHKRGFDVINSPIIFHTYNDNVESREFCNGEEQCCISYEIFVHSQTLVRFVSSKAVMTLNSFEKILDTPNDNFRRKLMEWKLLCPVTNTETPISSYEPLYVLY